MAMAFRGGQVGMGLPMVPDTMGDADPMALGMPSAAGLTMPMPPAQRTRRPGMFGNTFKPGGTGRAVAGYLGDALLQMSGGQPMYAPLMQQREQQAAEQAEFQRRYDMQRADTLADRETEQNKPQFFSGAEDRLRYDPTTGQTSTLYDAPTTAQEYAQGMGYQPDTPEYRAAMQDFTLKGYGATAMEARMTQDAQRTADRLRVRGTPTYRDTHPRPAAAAGPRPQASYGPPRTTNAVVAPILAKMSRGQPLTPNEQAVLDYNRRGGGGGGAKGRPPVAAAAGPTLTGTDPRTGKKLKLVNGAWVPAN